MAERKQVLARQRRLNPRKSKPKVLAGEVGLDEDAEDIVIEVTPKFSHPLSPRVMSLDKLFTRTTRTKKARRRRSSHRGNSARCRS